MTIPTIVFICISYKNAVLQHFLPLDTIDIVRSDVVDPSVGVLQTKRKERDMRIGASGPCDDDMECIPLDDGGTSGNNTGETPTPSVDLGNSDASTLHNTGCRVRCPGYGPVIEALLTACWVALLAVGVYYYIDSARHSGGHVELEVNPRLHHVDKSETGILCIFLAIVVCLVHTWCALSGGDNGDSPLIPMPDSSAFYERMA